MDQLSVGFAQPPQGASHLPPTPISRPEPQGVAVPGTCTLTRFAMYDPSVETRSLREQLQLDGPTYRRQVAYLFANSPFYRKKLTAAGFSDADAVGGLEAIAALPFTEKEELRRSQAEAPPFGEHLACRTEELRRVYSTSGTTGTPCYVGLTESDLDMYAHNVARGYTAAGFSRGQRIATAFNAGPFVAGAVFHGFHRMGCCAVPVGTGSTERLVTALRHLGASGLSITPSHALYLMDWCHERGINTQDMGVTHVVTAGEPGGGDPFIRERIREAFGCVVRESMGIADVSLSTWAEDADGDGMHFMARGFVHVELIDPESGQPQPWSDGARGELVYTALRREAMPLLRFRSRDHVVVNTRPNPTGRTGPRIRCVGRTDDMLIVRGVNLFPSALRGVLADFVPEVSGLFVVRPNRLGVRQEPPLPVHVELGRGQTKAPVGLAERLRDAIRSRLLVAPSIAFVPYGDIPRSTYKSRLVDYSSAESGEVDQSGRGAP